MKRPSLFVGFLIISATACKQDREIKVYHVAKESAAAAATQAAGADPHAGVPGMMPGGAMPGMPPGAAMPGAGGADPHGGLSAEQLAAASPPSSLQVSDSPPAHWKKQALSPMRLASYRIEGEGGATVDISFSTLRRAPGGTLANVNRWRDQLGQPPLDEAALKQAAQAVPTSFGEGVVVDIEGLPSGADAAKDGRLIGAIAEDNNSAWFFKMRGNAALTAAEKDNFIKWVNTVKPAAGNAAAPPAPPAPAAAPPAPAAPGTQPAAAGDGTLTWQLPAGWTAAPAASSMRYATFTVAAADGTKGEAVITHFPGDVGGDLQNVNRWLQQVSLPPVASDALAPMISTVTAGPKTLSLIDVTGAQTRLVAGWTRHGADTWFFKLTGPDALVAAEKAKFTAFLESVRFTKPE